MSAGLDVATRPCTLQELIADADTAYRSGDREAAERLIEAVYARLDAAAIANTSDDTAA